MNSPVHILATVRKPELIDGTLLVFKTIWRGFPNSQITVWCNGLRGQELEEVLTSATSAGVQKVEFIQQTSHDQWIEDRLEYESAPFWICDTDVVFFDRMPEPKPGIKYAGRFEPEFLEEMTGAIRPARLHTALMWFDPVLLRAEMRREMSRLPLPWRASAEFSFVRQTWFWSGGKTYLYDTCTGLWQAGLGTQFTDEQNASFEHLNCATYLDEARRRMAGGDAFAEMHRRVYENPEMARQLHESQAQYYASRVTSKDYSGEPI